MIHGFHVPDCCKVPPVVASKMIMTPINKAKKTSDIQYNLVALTFFNKLSTKLEETDCETPKIIVNKLRIVVAPSG